MYKRLILTLAATIPAVTGCSGGGEEPQTRDSPSQVSGNSALPQGCGSAVFDPVPILRCESLAKTPPAAEFDALPGGYWAGQFVDETQDVQGYVLALVAEDGRFQLQAYRNNETDLCHNWEAALTGKMTTTGSTIDGSGRMIALLSTLADGTNAADLEIDGVVAERDTLSATWSASSGDVGCFLLDQYFRHDYEAPSALEHLAGDWTDYASGSRVRLTVAADGSLSGNDQHGCNWAGYFGLVDDRYSLYEFEAELKACDRAGHYKGLAWHGDGWDSGEFWLQIRADDGNQALVVNFSSR